MKKITKRICIALLIAALALCAVGCGGSSSRRSNNSSSDRALLAATENTIPTSRNLAMMSTIG